MSVTVIKRNEKEKRRLKVAAYCRVSTDFEDQEGSIDKQREHYETMIRNNPEYEFAGVYVDTGMSGYKEKRPGFQQMLKDARAGKIDLIITKSITRFARNTDTVLKATRELKEMDIGVFFELQNINTLTQEGELLMTVYAAFAQGESETYRELAQMTYRRKCKAGKPEYRLQKTLGYDVVDGKVVIMPKEAETVKQIFTWVKEQYATETIVKMVKEKGLAMKPGREMRPALVYNIVRNVVYKGDYIMQRTFIDEERRVRINREDLPSYYIENDHPAIVTKKLWAAANKVIDDRAAERKRHLEKKHMDDENYPYRKFLYCAECGYPMHFAWNKDAGQYSFYCKHKMVNGVPFCKGNSVPQKVVESWGPITENIYISYNPDKPIPKRYSYVKESTWKKTHKIKPYPQMPKYNAENYHYYKKLFCAECGYPLMRCRHFDGKIKFICVGRYKNGTDFCSGIRIPEDKINNLPETDGYYLLKEEKIHGEKHYSYTGKKEKPQRKGSDDKG